MTQGMVQVNVNEASGQLAELVEAAMRGEAVFITNGTQETVQLIPVSPTQPPRKPGSAKGMISMSDDFNAPLEDFKDYTE
jgi:prevent-host-death family protein